MKTSWRDVLRECLALTTSCGTEQVSRQNAHGRVLAEDIQADRDYPSGDLSMMDGYAVDDRQESYRVEGENAPGSGAGAALAAGTARRIFTGAELPPGATFVIPQENVTRDGETLAVEHWPDTSFVRRHACEARQGGKVLAKGTRLGPVEVAVLATVGCREVAVTRQPLVSRLGTGDEIVSPDFPLPDGKIRDSNADLIDGLVRQVGLFAHTRQHVRDEREAVFSLVGKMAEGCDVLLISGGASVGDHDHARPALEAAGFTFLAHGLHLRPGRPVGIARRGEKWAVALPGNPLSHLVILRLLVIPILRACSGEANVEPQLIRGVLETELKREIPKRDTFWPAVISLRDGQFHARPSRFLSSGDLIGTVGINGFVSLPMNEAVPNVGEAIEILPLSPTFP